MSIGGTPGSDSSIAASARAAVRRALILSIISIAALYFAVGIAEAHGGGPGLGYDPCMRQAGTDDFIHLAVYQPKFNPFAEYCDSLPQAGQTLLVFDLIGAELPDAPVSLEVLRGDGRFQLFVPAQRYHSGVADLIADLPAGTYNVLVSIDEPGGRQRLAFRLAVGAWWERLVPPLVIVLLIAVITAGYCIFQVRVLAAERASSVTKKPVELQQRQN